MSRRYCPHCHCSTKIIKFGIIRGRQRFLCKNCGKTWINKTQNNRKEDKIWEDYARGGLSVNMLSKKYSKSTGTVRNILHSHEHPEIIPVGPADVIVMDATYFGRKWGILTVLEANYGRVLYCKKIGRYERVVDYGSALWYLAK